MARVAVHDRDPDILMCAFCSEICNDPILVPCHHSFCWDCLDHWCENKRPGDEAVCPTCGTAFVIPDNGIGGLKSGLAPEDLDIQWSPTESSQSTKYESKDQKITEVCSLHKKPRDMYCFVDNKAVCKMCAAADTRSLDFEDVTKVAKGYREHLTQDIQTLTSVNRKVDEKLDELSSRRRLFTDDVKKVEILINEKADEMFDMINKNRNKHISEVKKIELKHEKEMERYISRIRDEKKLLEDFITSYKNMLTKTDVEISQESGKLIKGTSKLAGLKKVNDAFNSLCVTKVSFSPADFHIDYPPLTLGQVNCGNYNYIVLFYVVHSQSIMQSPRSLAEI